MCARTNMWDPVVVVVVVACVSVYARMNMWSPVVVVVSISLCARAVNM